MHKRIVAGACAIGVLAAVSLPAQVRMRPTPPPPVTAEGEEWYALGEPLLHGDSMYYPAGPRRFFDGRTMVMIGVYRGVPLYVDATVEPRSMILVPIGRGLMQPYERARSGDLAGTTGSRVPAFPVSIVPERDPGTAPWIRPPPQVAVDDPEPGPAVPEVPDDSLATPGERREPDPVSSRVESVRQPRGENAVWIRYKDQRWFSTGPGERFVAERFDRVGEYRGFAVYVRRGDRRADRIYVRTGDWLAGFDRASPP